MSVSDFTRDSGPSDETVQTRAPRRLSKESLKAKLEGWIAQLHADPTAEERAAAERRALLLQELNQTVAEAPDDVPIKYVISRLNRHWDD